jgi:hypothetical protein
MKRPQLVLLAAACSLCLASGAAAQLGGVQFFSKPNIADIFKPVVGRGAVYQEGSADGKRPPHEMEMTIVGKEMTPSGEGYWMEMAMNRDGDQKMYSKVLMTKDFQFTKIIFQMPGQGAMEMPMNPNEKDRTQMKEEMSKWSQVGTETITVPAGTFSCALEEGRWHRRSVDQRQGIASGDGEAGWKDPQHGAGAADHECAGPYHGAGDAV